MFYLTAFCSSIFIVDILEINFKGWTDRDTDWETTDMLADWLVGWSVGWLVYWLFCLLVGCCAGLLFFWLVG